MVTAVTKDNEVMFEIYIPEYYYSCKNGCRTVGYYVHLTVIWYLGYVILWQRHVPARAVNDIFLLFRWGNWREIRPIYCHISIRLLKLFVSCSVSVYPHRLVYYLWLFVRGSKKILVVFVKILDISQIILYIWFEKSNKSMIHTTYMVIITNFKQQIVISKGLTLQSCAYETF